MEEEKEMIDGYEVRTALWIGNSRVIFAKSKDPTAEQPYMKCVFRENSLYGKYEDAVVSDDFASIMKLFADDIRAEAVALESETRAKGDAVAPCLSKEDVIPFGSDRDLHGEVVALKPDDLDDGYQDLTNQLYLVVSGFGADPNSRGSACYSVNLYSNKMYRVNRYELLGIVPEEKIPAFAKKTLELRQREKGEREER